jgi:hypothetical protein
MAICLRLTAADGAGRDTHRAEQGLHMGPCLTARRAVISLVRAIEVIIGVTFLCRCPCSTAHVLQDLDWCFVAWRFAACLSAYG